MIKDLTITPLKIIKTPNGDVLHGIKESDKGFSGFSEAYFSDVGFKLIKGWKRHKSMTLNLIVPTGMIKFVFYDDRGTKDIFQEIVLSRSNYIRVTVPPMIWVAFQGLDKNNSTLMNLANQEHDPDEFDTLDLNKINYQWEN